MEDRWIDRQTCRLSECLAISTEGPIDGWIEKRAHVVCGVV